MSPGRQPGVSFYWWDGQPRSGLSRDANISLTSWHVQFRQAAARPGESVKGTRTPVLRPGLETQPPLRGPFILNCAPQNILSRDCSEVLRILRAGAGQFV